MKSRWPARCIQIVISLFLSSLGHAQDYTLPLGTPGSAAARMRSMNEVEPRTVIYSLPCTITNGGSYTIISNLTGTSGSDGITIAASDVSLDLNGFALIGVSGSLSGITVPATRERLQIRNGTIKLWGSYACYAMNAHNGRFENLMIFSNGYGVVNNALYVGTNSILDRCVSLYNNRTGIWTSDGSRLTDCMSRNNGYYGFGAGKNCVFRSTTAADNGLMGYYTKDNTILAQCNAVGNGDDGFRVGWNNVIAGCASTGNANDGFNTGRGCVITDSAAALNGNHGFNVYHGSVVQRCSAYSNTNSGFYGYASVNIQGCSSMANGADGFNVTDGSRVSDCLAVGHTASGKAGIRVQARSVASGNTCKDNQYGIYGTDHSVIADNTAQSNTNGIYATTSAACTVIKNTASGNLFNDFNILSGNIRGPISTETGIITNVSPWANLEF